MDVLVAPITGFQFSIKTRNLTAKDLGLMKRCGYFARVTPQICKYKVFVPVIKRTKKVKYLRYNFKNLP